MVNCNFCGKSVRTLRGYVLHCKLHRNESRCLFKCFGEGCKQTFCRYGAFKAHFYRKHNVVSANANETVGTAVTTFKCAVALCENQCLDTKELLAHLKEHIVEGRAVSCPVRGCNTDFRCRGRHRWGRFGDLYPRNMSLFYLRLQSQFLLPAPKFSFEFLILKPCVENQWTYRQKDPLSQF